jgi:SAM-dependent methyltransferase
MLFPKSSIKKLLKSKEWPIAVPEDLICNINSKKDCENRAEDILHFIVTESVKDKRFLDYAGKDGSIPKIAKTLGAAEAYSYNSIFKPIWENKHVITNLNNKKFDIILLFDVLDHTPNIQKVLKDCLNLLDENGIIYCRCHPWCGRHGGDIYRQTNKAFAHWFLKDIPYNNEVIWPVKTYENYFKKDFNIIDKYVERWPLESFFQKEFFKKKVKEIYGDNDPHILQIEQCFVDFKLKKNEI